MKSKLIFLFCLQTIFFSLFACNLQIPSNPYYEVRVDAVVSKDTVKIHFVDYVPDGLQQVESVRLIGVQTPSFKSPDNQHATDESYAAEAADKIKSLCGKTFIIFFDKKLGYCRDAAGSLYAYLYQDTTSFDSINEQLIREGYARYWNLGLELENGKATRFEYAQEQAQFDEVGMWQNDIFFNRKL